jgi:hypothetical protein
MNKDDDLAMPVFEGVAARPEPKKDKSKSSASYCCFRRFPRAWKRTSQLRYRAVSVSRCGTRICEPLNHHRPACCVPWLSPTTR